MLSRFTWEDEQTWDIHKLKYLILQKEKDSHGTICTLSGQIFPLLYYPYPFLQGSRGYVPPYMF